MVADTDGDGVFDREIVRGRPDPLSNEQTVLYWNQEFRSTIWGHMTLLNLRYLFEPIFTGFRNSTHPRDVPSIACGNVAISYRAMTPSRLSCLRASMSAASTAGLSSSPAGTLSAVACFQLFET